LLAKFLRQSLFPLAESRPASLPGTDILNTPGVAFEMKATEQAAIPAALRQARANAAYGELPVVVYRPRGYGPEKLPQWVAAVSLEDLMALLHGCGFGVGDE
jgi:hypothetical protein